MQEETLSTSGLHLCSNSIQIHSWGYPSQDNSEKDEGEIEPRFNHQQ